MYSMFKEKHFEKSMEFEGKPMFPTFTVDSRMQI